MNLTVAQQGGPVELEDQTFGDGLTQGRSPARYAHEADAPATDIGLLVARRSRRGIRHHLPRGVRSPTLRC